jgi:hypothetical protein
VLILNNLTRHGFSASIDKTKKLIGILGGWKGSRRNRWKPHPLSAKYSSIGSIKVQGVFAKRKTKIYFPVWQRRV